MSLYACFPHTPQRRFGLTLSFPHSVDVGILFLGSDHGFFAKTSSRVLLAGSFVTAFTLSARYFHATSLGRAIIFHKPELWEAFRALAGICVMGLLALALGDMGYGWATIGVIGGSLLVVLLAYALRMK